MEADDEEEVAAEGLEDEVADEDVPVGLVKAWKGKVGKRGGEESEENDELDVDVEDVAADGNAGRLELGEVIFVDELAEPEAGAEFDEDDEDDEGGEEAEVELALVVAEAGAEGAAEAAAGAAAWSRAICKLSAIA